MTTHVKLVAAGLALVLVGGTAGAGPLQTAPDPADGSAAALAALADAARCNGEARRLAVRPRVQLAAFGDDALVQLAQAKPAVNQADDEDLFEKLGLMEGHLLIGKALADAGMMKDALPHFGHPIEEIYDYIKPVFAERGVPEFANELKDLQAQMERVAAAAPKTKAGAKPPAGKGEAAVKDDVANNAYVLALARIDALRRTIPDATREQPAFVLHVVAQMIENSGDDLAEAIENGRIQNRVEYHDAVGFARYADGLLKANAARLGKPGEQATREMRQVMTAFPGLNPPARPPVAPSALQAAGERVRALAK